MNPAQIGSFESIPLSSIRPSPTNPRKHFDESALAELTASIRELGVTVPIHVRSLFIDKDAPLGERLSYEIVTGERRFRAATAAGYEHIPAIVHDKLSDQEAMDLQMVENLQRADLHPVEEAEGYRALMAHGESAEDVAKMAGKALGYVQQRLKLLTLGEDAKQLFLDKHLTLDHALLLARLTAADQIRALVYLLGIAQWEIRKDTPAEKLIARRAKHFNPENQARLVSPSAAHLKDWITSNVLLVLKGVPWDLGDATLLPDAGPCTTCANRTGVNAALFADLTTVDDTCVSPGCFADKQKAFTRRQQEIAKEQGTPLLKISAKSSTEKLEKPAVEIRPSAVKTQGSKAVETKRAVVVATKPVKAGQWIAAKKGSCPSTVQAIAVDGPDQGKLKWVCADQSCKVHPRQVSRPRPTGSGHNGAGKPAESFADQEARRQREQKIEDATRAAVFCELMKADAQHSNAIARLMEFVLQQQDGMAVELPEVCLQLGLTVPGYKAGERDWQKIKAAKAKAQPVFRKYMDEATVPELHDAALTILALQAQQSYDEDDVERVSKMFGVNAEEIEETIRTKLAEDEKAAAAAKPAKPAKKSSAKKTAPIAKIEQLAAGAEQAGA